MDQPTPQYALRTKPWQKRWWGILLLIFLAIILITAFAVIFQTAEIFIRLQRGEISYQNQNSRGITANSKKYLDDSAAPYLGDPQAKIIIVEFGDFACPYTKTSAPVMREISRLYPDNVKIVWRNFPIVSEGSLPAAEAGACAREQGNFVFWAMADQLFANQDKLTADNAVETIKNIAKNLGLDSTKFNSCLDNNKYYTKINNDSTDAYQNGVQKTPTFFINGDKVEGYWPIDNWQKAIDYLLKNQPTDQK